MKPFDLPYRTLQLCFLLTELGLGIVHDLFTSSRAKQSQHRPILVNWKWLRNWTRWSTDLSLRFAWFLEQE